MKLREIIARLDKSDKNKSWINCERFSTDAGVYCSLYGEDLDSKGFAAYNIETWLCTDTHVGLEAIFYQDEFICISWQPARKSDIEYRWVDSDTRKKIAKILVEIMLENEEHDERLILADLDEEMGSGYKLRSTIDLVIDTAVFESTGETVKITQKWTRYDEIKKWGKVEIEFPNGDRRVVDINELIIPYLLKEMNELE